MSPVHDFYDSVGKENAHAAACERVLAEVWPTARIRRLPEGPTVGQIAGHDYEVLLPNGKTFYVDTKADTYTSGMAAMEIWSNLEAQKPGWSWCPRKTCDFVLYNFVNDGYAYLLPQQHLQAAVFASWDEWRDTYRTVHVKNKHYTTTCVLLPKDEMVRQFGLSSLYDTQSSNSA